MQTALRILMLLLVIAGTAFSVEQRVSISIGDSPSFGPADAPVTIIEFIDFQ